MFIICLTTVILMSIFGIAIFILEQNNIEIPRAVYWSFYVFVLTYFVLRLAEYAVKLVV